MDTSKDLFVKMILTAWESQNGRTTKLINALTDEQLHSEVSPGRNTGTYLLGHLVAVNDALLVTLGIGTRIFPAYEGIFLKSPDKSGAEFPAISTLKADWATVTQKLKGAFATWSPTDWFARHTAVSEEDFAKEPHRNRLNVLISRISHEAYHHGQLALLQKK